MWCIAKIGSPEDEGHDVLVILLVLFGYCRVMARIALCSDTYIILAHELTVHYHCFLSNVSVS